MSFINEFIGVFVPRVLAKNIIKANEDTYYYCRANNPGLNEHDYLAMTYAARRKAGVLVGNDSITEEQISILSYTETHQFAVLKPPDSIRALALYILYKEKPKLISKKLSSEYSKLVVPIFEAKEKGVFSDWYERTNPNKSQKDK